MTVLASGSKGNATVVSAGATNILVDAGLSCRELLRRLAGSGNDPAGLTAILITHEHLDHVASLSVLARKLCIPVFFTEATHRAWTRMMTPRKRMTYAQWLDNLRRERAARLGSALEETQAQVPDHLPAHRLASSRSPQGDRCIAVQGMAAVHGVAAQGMAAQQNIALAQDTAATHEASPPMSPTARLGPCEPEPCEPEPCEPDSCEPESYEPEPCEPEATRTTVRPDPAFLPHVEYFEAGKRFSIGGIDINPFTVPHDAADPCGFVFHARTENLRMAVATDLGYMPPNVKLALREVDVLLLESNHDLEMLRDGPYPWSLKQRVLSRVGHLSNAAAADFLTRDYDGGAHTIVLGHLSEQNNLPDLARYAAEEAIGDRLSLLGNRILLASQDEPLAPICL